MSCIILQDMALIVETKVSWTTAILVQEALDFGLHVIEDPPIIKFLGRTKFVDLVIKGTVGWHEGVRILNFSCTFKLTYYLGLTVSKVVYDVMVSSTYVTHLFAITYTDCNSYSSFHQHCFE